MNSLQKGFMGGMGGSFLGYAPGNASRLGAPGLLRPLPMRRLGASFNEAWSQHKGQIDSLCEIGKRYSGGISPQATDTLQLVGDAINNVLSNVPSEDHGHVRDWARRMCPDMGQIMDAITESTPEPTPDQPPVGEPQPEGAPGPEFGPDVATGDVVDPQFTQWQETQRPPPRQGRPPLIRRPQATPGEAPITLQPQATPGAQPIAPVQDRFRWGRNVQEAGQSRYSWNPQAQDISPQARAQAEEYEQQQVPGGYGNIAMQPGAIASSFATPAAGMMPGASMLSGVSGKQMNVATMGGFEAVRTPEQSAQPTSLAPVSKMVGRMWGAEVQPHGAPQSLAGRPVRLRGF